jgi:hypothetical protein
MKSKVRLSPEVKEAAWKYVQKNIHVERGFIATCMLTACAAALHDEFGFGRERVERFAAAAYHKMIGYFDVDPDTWIDMAASDCKRMGVEFDDYWIKVHDGGKAKPPVLDEEQKAYIKKCRTMLPTDEESKKIHDSWKYLK